MVDLTVQLRQADAAVRDPMPSRALIRRPWEPDALERKNLGEPVEVRVAVEHEMP